MTVQDQQWRDSSLAVASYSVEIYRDGRGWIQRGQIKRLYASGAFV